ncbi:MAG TPA: hypothetical protein VGD22_08700 [Sphingobacteriaceae bacterium]
MRLVISLCLVLLFAAPGFSQDAGSAQKKHANHEEIQAIKAAYITKKVDLTNEESKAFWPVYNAYQKEFVQLIHQRRENIKSRGGNTTAKLDDDFNFEERILELKKKYRSEFSRILPPEKVLTLYRAERDWKEYLIQELKARKKN